MKRIVVLPAARDDLRQERYYYEHRHPGSGLRSIQEARHAMERIAEAPEAMRVIKHNIRRWPVLGFPHGVLYRQLTLAKVIDTQGTVILRLLRFAQG